MVCLHTGFAQLILEMARQPDGGAARIPAPCSTVATSAARWIGDSGLVALIADNYAVEAVPARARATGDIAPRCRCTSIACSSSASISASSGISPTGRVSARSRPQPLPSDGAAAAAAGRRRLARDAGRDGVGRERHQQRGGRCHEGFFRQDRRHHRRRHRDGPRAGAPAGRRGLQCRDVRRLRGRHGGNEAPVRGRPAAAGRAITTHVADVSDRGADPALPR